jgi:hypothetical protein
MTEIQTYDSFIVKQIMPSQGWQAVYYIEEDRDHSLSPVYALALAYRVTRECYPSGRVVSPAETVSQKERWEIVGLEYDPGEPWTVCDTVANFCGLLPPGMTLETFMERSFCRHAHPACVRLETPCPPYSVPTVGP